MPNDFNPQKNTISTEHWSGQRISKSHKPEDGSNIAVIYIESNPDNIELINAKLLEIEELSKSYDRSSWTATSEEEFVARVDVSIVVSTNELP